MSSLIFLKRLALIGLLLVHSFSVNAEQTVLTLQTAIDLVTRDNPNLAQMQERAKAMAAIPSQQGTLADPEISFNAMSLPVNGFNLRQEDMTQLGVRISQAIPFPGKLALREQAAEFEAQAATHNTAEVRQLLLTEVKKNWWLVFYLDRALAIHDHKHNALKGLVAITRTKYEVGNGMQSDVILAQLELSKLFDEMLLLQSSRRNAAAALNALLNKPANEELKLPETVGLKLPNVKTETQLYQIAENARAILASNRLGIETAESRLALAKKDYLPDFMLEVGYGARANMPNGNSRADLLSLGVSMNLPIFTDRKQAKAVDQRSSELMQQKYALQDEWNKVRTQITQAYTDYQRTKNQVVLYNAGIVPQARQTVASMLAGYQVNKVSFQDLIRTQISLFDYEMQYWKSVAEANQNLAQLTAAVGGEEIYE